MKFNLIKSNTNRMSKNENERPNTYLEQVWFNSKDTS